MTTFNISAGKDDTLPSPLILGCQVNSAEQDGEKFVAALLVFEPSQDFTPVWGMIGDEGPKHPALMTRLTMPVAKNLLQQLQDALGESPR